MAYIVLYFHNQPATIPIGIASLYKQWNAFTTYKMPMIKHEVSLCNYLHAMNESIHQECVLGECLM